MHTRPTRILCLLLSTAGCAAVVSAQRTEARPQRFRGGVVDARGEPVPEARVDLGSSWTHAWFGPHVFAQETTRKDGTFRFVRTVERNTKETIWAASPDNALVGFATVPENDTVDARIVLHPGIRFRVRCARSRGAAPIELGWIEALTGPRWDVRAGWRAIDDGTAQFVLPPAKYRFRVHDFGGTHAFDLELRPGDRIVDGGEFVFEAPAPAAGRAAAPPAASRPARPAVSRGSVFGEPAPPWSFLSAKNLPAGAGPETFRGRWVLLSFTSPKDAAPAVPTWTRANELRRRYPALRDAFAFVTVFCHAREDGADQKDYLNGVREALGQSEDPRFPVAIDRQAETMRRYEVWPGQSVRRVIAPTGEVVDADWELVALGALQQDAEVVARLTALRAAKSESDVAAVSTRLPETDDVRATAALWGAWRDADAPTRALGDALLAAARKATGRYDDFDARVRRSAENGLFGRDGLAARDVRRRLAAAQSFSKGAPADIDVLLRTHLDDDAPDVRAAALDAVRAIVATWFPAGADPRDPPTPPPPFLQRSASTVPLEPGVALALALGLDESAPAARERLRPLLRHAALLGTAELRKLLFGRGGLRHERAAVRAAAAGALADRGDPAHRAAVEALLEDPDASVRASAAAALAAFDADLRASRRVELKPLPSR